MSCLFNPRPRHEYIEGAYETVEFRNLEDFAEFLGYDYPEEIHIVASCEGFYDTDEQGDPFLSVSGINDFLRRLGADIEVVSASPFISARLKMA